MDEESVLVEIRLDNELEKVMFHIANQAGVCIEDLIKVILALEIHRGKQ